MASFLLLDSPMICPGYSSITVHLCVPFSDPLGEWQLQLGVFIHGHVIAERLCGREVCPTGQVCGPPSWGMFSGGAQPAGQWAFSLASFGAGVEVFCEASSRFFFANVFLADYFSSTLTTKEAKISSRERKGWLETQAFGWKMEEAASSGLWLNILEDVTRPAVVCPSEEREGSLFASQT